MLVVARVLTHMSGKINGRPHWPYRKAVRAHRHYSGAVKPSDRSVVARSLAYQGSSLRRLKTLKSLLRERYLSIESFTSLQMA